MQPSIHAALICAVGICLLPDSWARADSVEKALMPGQVIEGHAQWEDNCVKCHKRFDKGAQPQLCLDCHKDIRADVEQRQGFHGRLKEEGECKQCHTEHKGRAENIAPINEQTFDHAKTDFLLGGAHANPKKVDCKACHKQKQKYRDAPSSCYACHKKDDTHKGRVGEACKDCHSENTWKDIRFDHKKTRYPLRGKHVATACRDCHAGDRYKNTPADCYSCHKKDDKHKGQEGMTCEECHNENSWKKAPFDHNKSRFPLLGKHVTIECKKCHLTQAFKEAPVDCYGCHKKDDKHRGSYGQKCETCHAERDWKTITFDHGLHTKYPLFGRHIQAKCESCHRGHLYKDTTPVDCFACHKKDDTHKGRYGEQCVSCHTERGWRILLFDHDRDTKYVLKGYHHKLKCDSCHKGQLYKDKTPAQCSGCHKKDDIHGARYGDKCDKCHGEADWKTVAFDHGRDTKYPLIGKHRLTTCDGCHTGKLYADKTPTECAACHRASDVHKKRLGSFCETCHSTRDWKIWDFDHDLKTKFKLDGGHKKVACDECHRVPMDKKVTASSTCMSCHTKDDKHEGQLGLQCERCHQTTSWKVLRTGAGMLRR